jgi:hypothetical protein
MWIVAMLSKRMVRAELRGVSLKMMVHRGCPQGGVLSPLLWKMVINSLLRQGFADDIAIVINDKFLSTVCELMQKAWCRRVGLSVTADKTSMVLFTNNRKLVRFKKSILF